MFVSISLSDSWPKSKERFCNDSRFTLCRRRKGGQDRKKKSKDDGLSAKQRRKIKSQAMVDSDSSDSDGGKRPRASSR